MLVGASETVTELSGSEEEALADGAALPAVELEDPEPASTSATFATTLELAVALPEPSLPTPALAEETSLAETASQTDSAVPTASTAEVSVKEPNSPDSERELTSQSRPRAEEQEAASLEDGTLKIPLLWLRASAESGALQSWKTLPSMRMVAPSSASKLWLRSVLAARNFAWF